MRGAKLNGGIMFKRGNNVWTIALLFCFSVSLLARDNGGISSEMLKRIENSFEMDAYTKGMQNAVSNNDIKELALNRELIGKIDYHFAYRIKTDGITDQKSSGRCWLFTGLNVIRPRIIEQYDLKDFEFSQNYLFFYDQLEKANLFLEAIIRTSDKPIDDREVEWLFKHPVSDGGVWNMVVSLVEKYGMIPKEAMPESYNSENTAKMRQLLRSKLREDGMKLRHLHEEGKSDNYLRGMKPEMLSEVYRILAICLGTPPKEFTWRYVNRSDSLIVAGEYTPMSFYKEVIKLDLSDYVMLMDDPSKKYYELYEIEYDRNLFDSKNWTFVNVPSSEVKKYAKKSILSDEPMYFSCDVGKQLGRERGIVALDLYDYESIFGIPFEMDKRERILTFDSGSTHGMALMGIDTSETGEPTKWLLENSWGSDDGYKGFLVMTDDWFDEYMFRIVIRKQFLPENVLSVMEKEPIRLPPWDPMY
jgi:bleomycin hydrolase